MIRIGLVLAALGLVGCDRSTVELCTDVCDKTACGADIDCAGTCESWIPDLEEAGCVEEYEAAYGCLEEVVDEFEGDACYDSPGPPVYICLSEFERFSACTKP